MVSNLGIAPDQIKGILLDRDGTINVERSDYVRSEEQFELLPGIAQAFSELATLSLPVVVVTNQAGIARGLISESHLASIHDHLCALARERGLELRGIMVCPHHPDAACSCRKPRPGLLLGAAALLGIRPAECLMIGDSMNDYWAARAAGSPVILVRSGRQGDQLGKLVAESEGSAMATPIVANLLEAARRIVESRQHAVSATVVW